MKLKQLKKYNIKLLKYLFILLMSFSTSSFACEEIRYSKSDISILSKNNNLKFKFNVELADNILKRKNGLQCRKLLNINEGMLFIWKEENYRYFWMKNTYMPLDIVFINSNLQIVDVIYNAKPLSLNIIVSKKKAMYVLEINESIFKKLGLAIGDKINF